MLAMGKIPDGVEFTDLESVIEMLEAVEARAKRVVYRSVRHSSSKMAGRFEELVGVLYQLIEERDMPPQPSAVADAIALDNRERGRDIDCELRKFQREVNP
jgi:hypothetical protein